MPCTHAHTDSHDDDLDDEPLPVHRIVPAAGQPFPETTGFVSVFDLAVMSLHMRPFSLFGLRKSKKDEESMRIQDATHIEIERSAGFVKVRRMHHTETQAWQDQETARRARQRPPKPTAKAKTKSRKLFEMTGAPN